MPLHARTQNERRKTSFLHFRKLWSIHCPAQVPLEVSCKPPVGAANRMQISSGQESTHHFAYIAISQHVHQRRLCTGLGIVALSDKPRRHGKKTKFLTKVLR